MHAAKAIKTRKKEPRSAGRLPAHWDNSVSDLSEYKASPAEIARRRAVHVSKNQVAAKVELQRRALNSVVKSAKKPLPAAFVREVLPRPNPEIIKDVAPLDLARCADRILERSAQITAQSTTSSVTGDFQNVNPTITKRTGSSNDSLKSDDDGGEKVNDMLPVQLTPMLRTRLDRLAETVTAPVALNEQQPQPPASKAESLKSTNGSRSTEMTAVLEQLFSALQIEALSADLIPQPSKSDDGNHPTLTGHTALLVRVLLGLVTRVKQLESQMAEMNKKVESNRSLAGSVNEISEKVSICEQKLTSFQENLRITSTVTTESLQHIRNELENIVLRPEPVVEHVKSPQSEGDHECHYEAENAKECRPVAHVDLDIDIDDAFKDDEDFDSEPWHMHDLPQMNQIAASVDENNNAACFTGKSKGNIKNDEGRRLSTSPPPSSIHCPSGDTSSIMFGDRLGSQLAELTRQHDQARARLQAMQRSVNHSMGYHVPINSIKKQ